MPLDDLFHRIIDENEYESTFTPYMTTVVSAYKGSGLDVPPGWGHIKMFGFFKAYNTRQVTDYPFGTLRNKINCAERFPLREKIDYDEISNTYFFDLITGKGQPAAAVFFIHFKIDITKHAYLFCLSADPDAAWNQFSGLDIDISRLGRYPPVSEFTKKIPDSMGSFIALDYIKTLKYLGRLNQLNPHPFFTSGFKS